MAKKKKSEEKYILVNEIDVVVDDDEIRRDAKYINNQIINMRFKQTDRQRALMACNLTNFGSIGDTLKEGMSAK
jgi:hypothetical protein